MDNLCNIKDCMQPTYSRGLCKKHYGHHHRRGTLDEVADPVTTAKPHRLTEKNLDNETAVCSICGPTIIKYRAYRDYWMCAQALSAYSKGWPIHAYFKDNQGKHRTKDEIKQIKDKMLEDQNSACAICGDVVKLHLDHCHDTNVLRGLLCPPCNMGLGHFKDDPARLLAAYEYVTRHKN